MRNNRFKWAVISTVIASAVTVVGCDTSPAHGANQTASSNGPTVTAADLVKVKYSGPVVATYTGGQLTKQELDQQYNLQVVLEGQQSQESKAKFASWYAAWYKYLYNKVAATDKTPIDVASAKQQADAIMTQLANPADKGPYKNVQEAQKKMKELHLTKTDVVQLVERTQVLQNYLEQQLYNRNKSLFIQVTVDEILVPTESEAKSIEAKLKAGANFAKLADQYSKDPGVKTNHGTYANAMAAEFVPHFAQACLTLPIGEISDPVHTRYGYHILRVDKRTQLSFAEATSRIQQGALPSNVSQTLRQDEQTISTQAQKAAAVKVVVKTADL